MTMEQKRKTNLLVPLFKQLCQTYLIIVLFLNLFSNLKIVFAEYFQIIIIIKKKKKQILMFYFFVYSNDQQIPYIPMPENIFYDQRTNPVFNQIQESRRQEFSRENLQEFVNLRPNASVHMAQSQFLQQQSNPKPNKFKRDRNIKSNALKLFLKYVRKDLNLVNGYHQKIISKISLKPNETVRAFKNKLEQFFPISQNYIKVNKVVQICHSQDPQLNFFLKVFRISLHKFFKETIYLLNSKYTRTKKHVRKQQIEAGLNILESIFGKA